MDTIESRITIKRLHPLFVAEVTRHRSDASPCRARTSA